MSRSSTGLGPAQAPDTAESNSSPQGPSAARPAGVVVVPLARSRSLEVRTETDVARLRVIDASEGPQRALEIEVRFSAEGPLVRVRAHALELEAADHVTTQCQTFTVHAREHIELRSAGTLQQSAKQEMQLEARRIELDASPGAVCLKANDEVQLLGEMILLNCDRPSAQPAWVSQPTSIPAAPLPPASASGDVELVEFLQRSTKAHE